MGGGGIPSTQLRTGPSTQLRTGKAWGCLITSSPYVRAAKTVIPDRNREHGFFAFNIGCARGFLQYCFLGVATSAVVRAVNSEDLPEIDSYS